jgi:hypothetical protein
MGSSVNSGISCLLWSSWLAGHPLPSVRDSEASSELLPPLAPAFVPTKQDPVTPACSTFPGLGGGVGVSSWSLPKERLSLALSGPTVLSDLFPGNKISQNNKMKETEVAL